MAQQIINTGATANDGTGEPLREAFTAVNASRKGSPVPSFAFAPGLMICCAIGKFRPLSCIYQSTRLQFFS